MRKVLAGWGREGVVAVGRGVGLFLGVMVVVNLVVQGWTGAEGNVWWVDGRGIEGWVWAVVMGLAGLGFLVVACGGTGRRWVRVGGVGVMGIVVGVVGWNVVGFYERVGRGEIGVGVRVPLSLGVMGMIAVVMWAAWRGTGKLSGAGRGVFGGTVVGLLVLWPLGQMFCFGETDYGRRADAIVVFGAAVYRDGTPSQALADRVNTAIDLYQRGLAPVLIFSGGPGQGVVTEAEAMRGMALAAGVPAGAIVMDEGGVHTDATVADTVEIFRERGYVRVMAVSHFYHLPRVKMAYERAVAAGGGGVEVVTVPAVESARMVAMPRFVGREVAAWWAYYLGM